MTSIGKRMRFGRRWDRMVVVEVLLDIHNKVRMKMLLQRFRGVYVFFDRSTVKQFST